MVRLTKCQRRALYSLWRGNETKLATYRQFRRMLHGGHLGEAVMIYWSHKWIDIEPDGYTHS